MLQRPRIYRQEWRLLGDRHATELVKAWEKTTQAAVALYSELRRRNEADDGEGYPTRSMGGSGASSEPSNRPLEIVIRKEESGGSDDPIRELLIRGEAMLSRCEREIAAWCSQVQSLPAINPPEYRPREVCVDCGGSQWIVGKLELSRCPDCRRRMRSTNRRLERRKKK